MFYQTFGWKPADGPVFCAEPSSDERSMTVPHPRRCRHRLSPALASYHQPTFRRRQSCSQSAAGWRPRTPPPPTDEQLWNGYQRSSFDRAVVKIESVYVEESRHGQRPPARKMQGRLPRNRPASCRRNGQEGYKNKRSIERRECQQRTFSAQKIKKRALRLLVF